MALANANGSRRRRNIDRSTPHEANDQQRTKKQDELNHPTTQRNIPYRNWPCAIAHFRQNNTTTDRTHITTTSTMPTTRSGLSTTDQGKKPRQAPAQPRSVPATSYLDRLPQTIYGQLLELLPQQDGGTLLQLCKATLQAIPLAIHKLALLEDKGPTPVRREAFLRLLRQATNLWRLTLGRHAIETYHNGLVMLLLDSIGAGWLGGRLRTLELPLTNPNVIRALISTTATAACLFLGGMSWPIHKSNTTRGRPRCASAQFCSSATAGAPARPAPVVGGAVSVDPRSDFALNQRRTVTTATARSRPGSMSSAMSGFPSRAPSSRLQGRL